MKDMFKDIWFWATVILLALLLYKSCGKGNIGFLSCNKSDTLKHKIDTTVKTNKDTSGISFVPKEVHDTLYYPRWIMPAEKHDTLEIPVYFINPITDTLSELKRLQVLEADYNKRKYFTSDSLRDKNGKWVAVINDTTQANRIIGTGLSVVTTCSDTTIKETTTILKHKMIAYVSFGLHGNRSEPFAGGSLGLLMKGKNDVQFGVEVMRLRNPIYDKNIYGIKAVLPIRLLKRR